ncbi:MAG: hypothetical protein LBM93_09985 [Oscillospiraceae bacterium]|jgi:hypothetical protein|nr:hypothetical protein [Oscillospiraceae bacterium]
MAITVLCPILPAFIKIGITDIDNVSDFTKFILWCLSENYSADVISEKISINAFVVQGEINYLLEIKYINEVGQLTETGKSFVKLCNAVNKCNNENNGKGYKVCVNAFTGEIIDYMPALCRKDIGNQKLSKRINLLLTRNVNYSNSQDFIIGKYNELIPDLNSERLSCYLELESKEPQFYTYTITELPKSECDFVKRPTDVVLVYDLLIYKLNFSLEHLIKFRPVIETLTKLQIFEYQTYEKDLLTEFAHKIIADYTYELEVNDALKKLEYSYNTLTEQLLCNAYYSKASLDVKKVKPKITVPYEHPKIQEILCLIMSTEDFPKRITVFKDSVNVIESRIDKKEIRIPFSNFKLLTEVQENEEITV